MENFKVEFSFIDSEDCVLHVAIEYVEAEDYDDAQLQAGKVCEDMCAQAFYVVPNN